MSSSQKVTKKTGSAESHIAPGPKNSENAPANENEASVPEEGVYETLSRVLRDSVRLAVLTQHVIRLQDSLVEDIGHNLRRAVSLGYSAACSSAPTGATANRATATGVDTTRDVATEADFSSATIRAVAAEAAATGDAAPVTCGATTTVAATTICVRSHSTVRLLVAAVVPAVGGDPGPAFFVHHLRV